jgi:hypothetical protein
MAGLSDIVQQKSIMVSMSVSRLGIRRDVSTRKIQVRDQTEGETDMKMLSASKKLVDCEEYDAIVSLDGDFYRKLMKKVLPSYFKKGIYLLPMGLFDWFEVAFKEYQEKRSELVATFLTVYDRRVEEAKERLKTLFDPQDYPSLEAVKSAFSVMRSYPKFTVDPRLESINSATYAEVTTKLNQVYEEAAQEIRQALRVGLLEMLRTLEDRLVIGADGSKKVVREAVVNNLVEWLDLFNKRDLTNDIELLEVVAKVKEVIGGMNIKKLRLDNELREEAATKVKGICDQLAGMVVIEPKRRFDFSEE